MQKPVVPSSSFSQAAIAANLKTPPLGKVGVTAIRTSDRGVFGLRDLQVMLANVSQVFPDRAFCIGADRLQRPDAQFEFAEPQWLNEQMVRKWISPNLVE